MPETLKCEQCSSTQFTLVSQGQYRCDYCNATVILKRGQAPPVGRPTYDKPAGRRRHARVSGILITAVAVVIGVCSAGVVFFAGSTDASLEKEVSQAVAVSPVPVLEASFNNVHVTVSKRHRRYEFFGLYRNDSETPITRPIVTVQLTDAAGRDIATGRGIARRDFVLPGEVEPIQIMVFNVSKDYQYDISWTAAPYEKSHERPSLRLEKKKMSKRRHRGYEISGEVHNDNDDQVRNIQIVGWLTNKAGNVVGTRFDHIGTLPPGENHEFTIRLPFVEEKATGFGLTYNAE